MLGLLIAIFTGWLGGYRFYKRQTVLGVVYLLTFGIIGVGWIVDVVQAYEEYSNKRIPATMVVPIKGIFAECKRNPAIKRRDVLKELSIGTPLSLDIDYYNGSPYYQVVAPNGLDLGAIPSDINRKLQRQKKITLQATLESLDKDNPLIRLNVR